MSETDIEDYIDTLPAAPATDPEAGTLFPLVIGLAAAMVLLAQTGALQ